jgi:simple sugar transport system substrate-binding protein
MVSAMETALNDNVDGIAVPMIHAEAFNGLTATAVGSGIPVIAYNADTPNSRSAYVGQKLMESGYDIAKMWLPRVTPGSHVLLSIATPGTLNLQPRLDGYIQAIKEAGNAVTFEAVETGVKYEDQLARIESYFLGHRNLAALIGTDAPDTLACGQVARKYGLARQGVIAAGYGLMPQTLALVESGDLLFSTDQQAYLQGLYPSVAICIYKETLGAEVPVSQYIALRYVSQANVHSYPANSYFNGGTRVP